MSETKQTLAVLGLGATLCLPCLALIAGVSVATSGAAVLALVRDPVAQVLAALLVVATIVAIWRYVAYRRECAVDRTASGLGSRADSALLEPNRNDDGRDEASRVLKKGWRGDRGASGRRVG